ncbi:MAG TPA: DedA family protein [Cyanobacteria bacterium UBA8530]|nr:DedA family protein [Cyanobacteria bacterium UBA8530]
MEEIIASLIPWLEHWGYLAVFLGIMLENAGIPVPGETLIIAAAILAGQGVLNIQGVFLMAVAGAILGDNLGYWLGLKGGRALLLRHGRWLGITSEKLEEAELLFRPRSEWAVFFGRFVAILRIFAGPLAGIIRMPYPRFLLFNSAGAFCWVAVVAGLSFLLGNNLEGIVLVLRRLGWIGLFLFGAGALILFLRRKKNG